MKKIVVLTGAGISAESGLSTFRDEDGLWEQHPVERVATHEAWERDPVYVNDFYNMLRGKLLAAKPNDGHRLVADLEKKYQVTVVTQNVDNLHERAGSSHVIHLHGELTKVCSSRDPYDERYIQQLTPETNDVKPGALAGDGSLLRPFIVFFGESVPMLDAAARKAAEADVFVIIGSSLNVYPAAGLVRYTPAHCPIFLIDPNAVSMGQYSNITHIEKGASEGMRELVKLLKP